MNKLSLQRPLLIPACVFACALPLLLSLAGCQHSAKAPERPYTAEHATQTDFEKTGDKPPSAHTLYAVAEVLAVQQRDAECQFVLNKSIADYPEFIPAYNALAELLMRQGRVNQAIQVLSAALEMQPRDPVLLNNLGMCWIVRGNYQRALDLFSKASGIVPTKTRYRANMAAALGLMAREAEAKALYDQILSEDDTEKNLVILRKARETIEKMAAASKD